MKIFGIDLGTTNSVVCEYRKGEPMVLNINDKATVPSVIYIKDGQPIVGQEAKKRLMIAPDQCLSATKRQIGSSWSKKIEGTSYTPTKSAELILKHLKEQAQGMQKVVITIPAYFEEQQRQETMRAAEAAGLEVLRLLPEPTAAAIRYGLDREVDQTLVIIDLGGGTFDVSVLEVLNNDFIVKAVDGNHQLGGEDIDHAIVEHINQHIETNFNTSVREDPQIQQRLKEEAERAKIELSASKKAEVYLPALQAGMDLELELSREELRVLIQPLLDELITKTLSVMEQAGMSEDDISRFVLVGGSCKHPLVREQIKKHFKEPFISDNMDTAVAEGAAIVCANLLALSADKSVENSSETPLPIDLSFQDVIAHSLGVDMLMEQGFLSRKLEFVPILAKNKNYPCKNGLIAFTTDEWQSLVVVNVYRGEDKDPKKNTRLGELEIPISNELIGKEITPIGSIFELDSNGILSFTLIEMPLNNKTRDDLTPLIDEIVASGSNCVPFERLVPLIEKHGFKTTKTTIKTV